MSDRAIQSNYGSADKRRHPLHNYQSQDMSHPFGASFNSAHQEQNQIFSPVGHDTGNYLSFGGGANASDISGPLKGISNVESGSGCLTTGSRNYSISKPSFQGYPISYQSQPPISYHFQQSGRRIVLNYDKEASDVQALKSQLALNFGNTNTALCISRGDFSSVHRATPFWAGTSHSALSQIQPQGFILGECIDEGGRRSSVPFLVCRQEKADQLRSMQAFKNSSSNIDPRILKHAYGNYQADSTLFLSQENKDICSTSRTSLIPMLRKDDSSFLMLNNVSPNHNHSQPFFQEQHQGIQKLSEIGLVPSWSNSSKFEMLEQQHRLQKRFRSMHDIISMRSFTPVSSVRRANEGPYMNSETTRILPNGERVNVNFCKENPFFEKSGVLSGHSQQGVNLQLLDSSTASGGSERVQRPSACLFVSKNESSAETGALNTDIKEKHLSGAISFPVNKDGGMYGKSSSTEASVTPEEGRSKPVIPVIPDLNIALPELPGADNLMGQPDPSTQRSKISDQGSLHAREPTTKTRKKRKMSDIINSVDSPRQEIVNKSVRQSGKSGRTNSKLTFAGKELIVLDSDDDTPASVTIDGSSSKELIEVEKKKTSDKKGKTPSAEGERKTEEITPHSLPLNPPTILQTAQENPEQTVVYKPQNSNVTFEPIPERKVPSAAAMAAITSDFNRQIDINDKEKGSHKGQENQV